MNKIKWIISILLTLLAQYGAIVENGYWGLGGNALVPILCWLLFWIFPNLIRELKKEFK